MALSPKELAAYELQDALEALNELKAKLEGTTCTLEALAASRHPVKVGVFNVLADSSRAILEDAKFIHGNLTRGLEGIQTKKEAN